MPLNGPANPGPSFVFELTAGRHDEPSRPARSVRKPRQLRNSRAKKTEGHDSYTVPATVSKYNYRLSESAPPSASTDATLRAQVLLG